MFLLALSMSHSQNRRANKTIDPNMTGLEKTFDKGPMHRWDKQTAVKRGAWDRT